MAQYMYNMYFSIMLNKNQDAWKKFKWPPYFLRTAVISCSTCLASSCFGRWQLFWILTSCNRSCVGVNAPVFLQLTTARTLRPKKIENKQSGNKSTGCQRFKKMPKNEEKRTGNNGKNFRKLQGSLPDQIESRWLAVVENWHFPLKTKRCFSLIQSRTVDAHSDTPRRLFRIVSRLKCNCVSRLNQWN